MTEDGSVILRRQLRLNVGEIAILPSRVREVAELLRDRNVTLLSAAIAYYAFVSVIPLLLLSVVLASLIAGDALTERMIGLVSQELSASGQELVRQVLDTTSGRGAAWVVGSIGLFWSALKLFRGLDQAFDEIYADRVSTSLLEQILHSAIALLGIALAVSIVGVIWWALGALEFPFSGVIGQLVLMGCLSLVFLPMYYVLPPVPVTVGDVIPGAIVAAVGIVILQWGFRIYAANAQQFGVYGIIGSVLVFVTWLYFASIILLLGVAVNASGQSGQRMRVGDDE